MSVSSYIKLKNGNGKIPKSHDPYGDTYPYIREFLDKTAKALKERLPTTYEFQDPEFYSELFDGDMPPELAKRLETQKEWHDAAHGLKTFASLLSHFRAIDEEIDPGGNDRRSLIYELEAFQIILKAAAKKKDSFRIEILE